MQVPLLGRFRCCFASFFRFREQLADAREGTTYQCPYCRAPITLTNGIWEWTDPYKKSTS